jgi:glutathione synthase/RimK-type ligase-like ATP-grasp enzyme
VSEPVLLLTHSGDFFTIDRVQAAVEARGARAVRVDTDRFPAEAALSVHLDGEPRVELQVDGETLRLDRARAVWARRLWPGRLPDGVDARYAHHASRESRAAFFDALPLVEGERWMNAWTPQKRAENKLLQLREARALGFDTPDTLVSSAPDDVRAFARARPGPLATKLLGALSQTMDASGDFVYTSRVDDTEDLEGLELCPQVFQPYLEKARELRVVVVDDAVFAGGIDPGGRADWRQLKRGEATWFEVELPADVEARCLGLCRALGLRFGAVDLIVDDEERHWFLEVNPAGEWGWLERDLGLDISGAIADGLLR